MNKNPLEVFKKEAPEVQEAYSKLINTLICSDGLDAKTKQLVYIAIKVVADDKNAIKYHVSMAKAAGATREEIKDTVLLSLTVCGLKGISQFLPLALEIFDNENEINRMLIVN